MNKITWIHVLIAALTVFNMIVLTSTVVTLTNPKSNKITEHYTEYDSIQVTGRNGVTVWLLLNKK